MNFNNKKSKEKSSKQFVGRPRENKSFLKMIKTDDFQVKWESSLELDYSDPNNVVNYITDILTSAADKAKIKTVKKGCQGDPPWFDQSCQELKENIKALGKKIKSDPKNSMYRTQLTSEKKD